MNLTDLSYNYPKELVSQHPLPERDGARMMVLDRTAQTWQHSFVKNLPEFLQAGDLIVFNDTKVIPARLFGTDEKQQKIEVVLLERIRNESCRYRCLVHPSRKIVEGIKINFGENWSGIIVAKNGSDAEIEFPAENFDENLIKFGVPPLPPYIKRKPEEYSQEDRERYQTVFAKHEGSAAAPTASLHFTENLLSTVRTRGVEMGWVTLHVSTDTFQPIRCANLNDHPMHGEQFFVPGETQRQIRQAKQNNKRVIAVGTTVVRALESDWNQPETKLFITPGFSFKIVDALLTNFHQPQSTLLALVSVFAGLDFVKKAYQEAITQNYRLFSFGDCMLII